MDEPFLRFEGSITQILTRSDPKIRGKEPKTPSKLASNTLMQNEAGLTKPTAHPRLRLWARPLRGPDGWVGD